MVFSPFIPGFHGITRTFAPESSIQYCSSDVLAFNEPRCTTAAAVGNVSGCGLYSPKGPFGSPLLFALSSSLAVVIAFKYAGVILNRNRDNINPHFVQGQLRVISIASIGGRLTCTVQ